MSDFIDLIRFHPEQTRVKDKYRAKLVLNGYAGMHEIICTVSKDFVDCVDNWSTEKVSRRYQDFLSDEYFAKAVNEAQEEDAGMDESEIQELHYIESLQQEKDEMSHDLIDKIKMQLRPLDEKWLRKLRDHLNEELNQPRS